MLHSFETILVIVIMVALLLLRIIFGLLILAHTHLRYEITKETIVIQESSNVAFCYLSGWRKNEGYNNVKNLPMVLHSHQFWTNCVFRATIRTQSILLYICASHLNKNATKVKIVKLTKFNGILFLEKLIL